MLIPAVFQSEEEKEREVVVGHAWAPHNTLLKVDQVEQSDNYFRFYRICANWIIAVSKLKE